MRLRKQAKRWLRELRAGDLEALRRLERALPGHSNPPGLREVQQALARELGFASWAELKEHHATPAASRDDRAALLDAFLEHACIFTPPRDLPIKWRRAERIRARSPEIATASLHAAVVCGEVEHVRGCLEADPGLLEREGGPQRWEPLLFACYGRLPNEQARTRALDVARLLLDAGADPNTHFIHEGGRLRFNALTGVMGQGEMGQPEHPQADTLARWLLERGADPNDSQGLYNTHLVGDDTRWLELLIAYGLDARSPVSWSADPADAPRSRSGQVLTMFEYLLPQAASHGHVRRLALLLEHGADPNARSFYTGKTAYACALLAGHHEAAELLRRHGAEAVEVDGHDAFVVAVRAGDRRRAERLLEPHPEYLEVVSPLLDAARRGEVEMVRLLLELGVDPNRPGPHGHRALNQACQDRELSLLLLEHGADPRGRAFGGTACEWAWHGGNLEMARFHAEHSRSLLDAVRSGHLALVREILARDPASLQERAPNGNGPLHELGTDVALAEPIIAELLAHGADPELRNQAGETPAQHLEAEGADEVADLLESMLA